MTGCPRRIPGSWSPSPAYDSAVPDFTVAPLGFRKLPGGFGDTLAAWSRTGPVAYVEADYFGGVGEQRAAVWADGDLVLGPLDRGENDLLPVEGSPTSQALRRLGAESAGDFGARRPAPQRWIFA